MKYFYRTFLCLLLIMAGTKMAAQQVVLHYPDGRQFKLNVSELDSISFHPNSWQDPTGEPNRVVMTLVADFEEGSPKNTRGQQRIHMGTEGSEKSMLWDARDSIWVGQPGNLTRKFSLASGAGSKQGEFTGIVLQNTPITAIYPYQEGIRLGSNGEASGITLPSVQKPVAGSCDPRAALMMAVAEPEGATETVALSFKNICSYIEITPTEALSQVTITAHDASGAAVPLAGTLTITYNNGEPSYGSILNGSNTVTLDGPLEADLTYYIAVLPGTKAAGFHITCCKGAQSMTRGYDNSVNFNRSKYRNCSAFTTGGTYSEADYVDMELTGDGIHRYWATRNLGAGSPTDFGSYFAWGDTEGLKSWDKAHFDWEHYKHGDRNDYIYYSETFVTKYNDTDALTTLIPADDAATQLWGTEWKMPTKADYEALNTQCHKEYTSNYKGSGVNGYIFYQVGHSTAAPADGKVDESNDAEVPHIFLPWGGYYQDNTIVNPGAHGYYWSSEVEPSVGQGRDSYNYARAYDFVMKKDGNNQPSANTSADFRRGGQSIRAVYVGKQ